MPSPSLLIVPARFKTGRLYSQIPTANGDFTVTRATAATRVNASGLIESVASGIPRLDYFASGGVVGCPALLVEPSGSNLLIRSEEFDNASWNKTGLTTTTGSTTAFTAPDGNLTAEALTLTLVSGGHICNQFLRWPSGTLAVGSVYVKPDTATKFFIGNGSLGVGVFFNLSNGTIEGTIGAISGTISAVGNGYYRVTATHTATASQTLVLGIYQTFVSGDYIATVSFTPSSANLLYVWGAQLETGTVATSYIPTTTAAVTRNADVISVTGAVSGSIGQTSGTIYAEVDVRAFSSSAARRIVNLRVDGNNLLSLEMTTAGTGFDFVAVSGGVIAIASASGITTGIYKIAVGYNSAASGTALYVNGTLRDTKTIVIPNLSAAGFGLGTRADGAAGTQLNDRIRAVALYTERLTNEQLAALTAP